jgi:cysteine desulfurase
MTRVYLDHNATSPLLPAARAAMVAVLETGGNPSSVHAEGRAARATVERARAEVAALVDAKPAEVIFTSGGSEANTLALRGAVKANGIKRLLVGATEHDSVLATAADLAGEGVAVDLIPVDRDGQIDLHRYASLLGQDPGKTLVSVMLANNETGVRPPFLNMVALARTHRALMHCDAVQAVGRLPILFQSMNVDLLTISAHKLGGPSGIGALIVRDGVPVARQIAGGGQELGRRAGTENVPAIAGFGAAAAHTREHWRDWLPVYRLRDRLEAAVRAAVPNAVIHGAEADTRLPNTSLIGLPGVSGETQVVAMDLAGFAISSGAACSSGKVKASHVLTAMGAAHPGDAIRVSLAPTTTEAEVDAFVAAWTDFATRALARRTQRAA